MKILTQLEGEKKLNIIQLFFIYLFIYFFNHVVLYFNANTEHRKSILLK